MRPSESYLHLRLQNLTRRESSSRASLPSTWTHWGLGAVCSLALLSAACSEEAPTPRTGSGQEEASSDESKDDAKPDGKDEPSDDDTSDQSKPATPAKPQDAGSKVDARAAVLDAASTPPTPDADGGGDAGAVGPGTPVVLPTPDQKGPYEVVKLENVGVGFENPPTSANDRGDGAGCTDFVQSFGETPEAARDYALFGPDYKVELYTLYYPKNMVEGQLYPILSWANGTCAKTNGYNALLEHLTTHGFIVVATNSRYTGGGKFQLRGVDYVVAENDKADSPLYKHVDVAKVGVFGHSQGGGSTWSAAADKRVKTSVVLNAGGSGTRPTPTYFVTGDKDLSPEASLSGAKAQTAAAAIRLHKIEGQAPAGHITLMKEPARVYPSVTAWFRYHLLADDVGKSWFVGPDCKLCKQPEEWDFFAKGLQ